VSEQESISEFGNIVVLKPRTDQIFWPVAVFGLCSQHIHEEGPELWRNTRTGRS